jgi:hypothetical protein
MAVYQHHHYHQPNLKTRQSQKSHSKSSEADNVASSIKMVFSFFVSFFPLDIVTRRSEQEPKQAASRVWSKKVKKKSRRAGLASGRPSSSQYSNMTKSKKRRSKKQADKKKDDGSKSVVVVIPRRLAWTEFCFHDAVIKEQQQTVAAAAAYGDGMSTEFLRKRKRESFLWGFPRVVFSTVILNQHP